jgi:predicted extracellular nuclease
VDAAPPPEPDLSALAAALQSDARDSSVYFRVLCSTLEEALPTNTTVEREHSVFKKNRVARKVTVNLGDETFEAEESAGRLVCRHIHSVQGVGGGLPYVKEVSTAEWVAALVASVTQDAGASSAAAAALRSLTT